MQYKPEDIEKFQKYMGIKDEPNSHEKWLFHRAKHYIKYISWIPGIEMVAVVNSLSMYATHADSDIDLAIMTRPGSLWYVRGLVTLIFTLLGVRRKEDVKDLFCLSFFFTSNAMDMSKIAIENDIYLYHWVKYLTPIFEKNRAYDRFKRANDWVFWGNPYDEEKNIKDGILEKCVRLILLPKTMKSYENLGKPWGIIISHDMLKFHPLDRRKTIRDAIFGEEKEEK